MKLKLKGILLTLSFIMIFASYSVFAQITSENLMLDLEGDFNRIFVNTSPIISVNLTNSEDIGKTFNLDYTVTDREGNVLEEKSLTYYICAKTTLVEQIKPVSDFGSYILEANLTCDDVKVTKKQYYAVVPKMNKKNDFFGLCTHFNAETRESVDEAFPQLEGIGAGWIREDLLWRECETKAGEYKIPDKLMKTVNYANQHGIKVLVILNAGNSLYDNGEIPTSAEGIKAYGEFCKNISNQLKGKVHAFEIWNEPELFNPEATGGQYAMLLKSAYESIKHEDGNPDAIVVGGALTAMKGAYGAEEYLKEMLCAGAHNYMDAFSFHPYVHGRYYPDEYSLKSIFDNMEIAEKWLNQAGAEDLPIWLTEVGYYDDGGTQYRTENDQAAAIARMVSYLKHNPRVERMFVYNYKEKGTDVTNPEDKFGIVSYYYYPKTAYSSLAFANKLLSDAEPVCYEKTTSGAAYSFKNKYEEDIFSVWAPRGWINAAGDATQKTQLVISQGDVTTAEVKSENGGFTIKIPDKKVAVLYDMYGNTIAQNITDGQFIVSHEPMYVAVRPKSGIMTGEDGIVRVSGYTEPDSFVTLVVKDGKSAFGKYVFVSQAVSDEDGRYSFEFLSEHQNIYAVSVYDGALTEERLSLNGHDVYCRIFDKSGTELTDSDSLFAADEINVKIFFNGIEATPKLYGATYKSDDRIVSISGTDEAVSANLMEMNIKGISEAEKLKIMLWDDSLKPLCQSIEIE